MEHLIKNASTNITGPWIDLSPRFSAESTTIYIWAGTWGTASVAIEITDSNESTGVAFPVTTLAAVTENTAAQLNFNAGKVRAVITGASGTSGLYVAMESHG